MQFVRSMRASALSAVALAFGFGMLNAAPVKAAVITENTSSTGTVSVAQLGQSATMPATGGPWSNVTFNYYLTSTGAPFALGKLDVLTQPYLGFAAISSSTPGYLASTTTITDNAWDFGSSLSLQPNTKYYFYATWSGGRSLQYQATGGSYPGGEAYVNNTFWTANPSGDANFTLSGPGAAAPEPASLALIGAGAALLDPPPPLRLIV